jgi:REP element-mobilizing transposase RayT
MGNKQKYNPKIHHRRSIRLKDYDYSNAGLYFITICVQDRKCLFGKIIYDEMILNDAGKMIDNWWQKIPEKFPDILLDDYVIMPNHFHAIVENVGVDLYVRPEAFVPEGLGQTQGSAPTGETFLYSIVQWFKTMTTNEYIRNVKELGWEPFDKKIWQRNYHEHIIRDQKSYLKISEYIRTNPLRWQEDQFYI